VFNSVEEIEPPTPLFFSQKQLLREYKKTGLLVVLVENSPSIMTGKSKVALKHILLKSVTKQQKRNKISLLTALPWKRLYVVSNKA
jgi:hypothetical protein